jgi:hypothetical protein
MNVCVRSYRAGGLVTLGVPQNRRRKVVTLAENDTEHKEKAVPLHAMEALGGRGSIAPTRS